MKTLRKQCAVVILTLTMAISAYAGVLDCPGYTGGGNGNNTVTNVITTVIVTVVTTVP